MCFPPNIAGSVPAAQGRAELGQPLAPDAANGRANDSMRGTGASRRAAESASQRTEAHRADVSDRRQRGEQRARQGSRRIDAEERLRRGPGSEQMRRIKSRGVAGVAQRRARPRLAGAAAHGAHRAARSKPADGPERAGHGPRAPAVRIDAQQDKQHSRTAGCGSSPAVAGGELLHACAKSASTTQRRPASV